MEDKKTKQKEHTEKAPPEVLQKRATQAKRADTSLQMRCQTLLEFLTYLVRQTWIVRSSEYHATEQAQSSGHATEQTQSQRYNISEEDCENIVFDTFFGKFFEQFYDEPALLLHKHMWDIMSRALAKHTILQVRLVLLIDGLMRTELLCMSAFIGKTRCGT